jgi:hypothetical protein
MIAIHERYEGYEPMLGVRPAIERLLSGLPPGYLSGLESLVLTNSQAVGRGKTGRVRGRKFKRNECLGFYHPVSASCGPWIEIIVDRIIPVEFPKIVQREFLFEILLSKTLFHEVGHHLDVTIGSPARAGERAADAWSEILRKEFFRKNHKVLTPVIRAALRLFAPSIKRKCAEIASEARRPPN